ncbi:MAG: hypothetical protein M3328_15060 [Chloroflexota bacterium]|nr:hypothetical protein [Chloroflexota bacterium]
MIARLRNKLIITCLLGWLCLVLVACGGAAEPVDEGPNAHLSNDELLALAIDNMKQIESYQMVFRGDASDDSFVIGPNTVITAQMQSDQKGSRVAIGAELPNPDGSAITPDVEDTRVDIHIDMLITEKETYHSDDGGKTWHTYEVDTGEDYLLAFFGTLWDTRRHGSDPTVGEQLIQGLAFEDGTPRIEMVDGVTTRHMVATRKPTGNEEAQEAFMGLAPAGGTGSIWVSTDITPTIRQMRIEGVSIVHEGSEAVAKPFALHWKWSRFNEDFGKVEPPPPDTIKPPY